jgi:hypothetical protein
MRDFSFRGILLQKEIVMKKQVFLLIAMPIFMFCIMGCASTKGPEPVVYSFAEEEAGTALITFTFRSGGLSSNDMVYFVDFEGARIPQPAEGTYWSNTVSFPAGVPFKIKTYVVRDRYLFFENLSYVGDPELAPLILIGFILYLPIDIPSSILGDRYEYVVFDVPPLEAGGVYELRYKHLTFIKDRLTLVKINERQTILKRTKRTDGAVIQTQTVQASLGARDKGFSPQTGQR